MFPAMPILTAIRTEAAPNGPTVEAFEHVGTPQWPERMRPAFICPWSDTITWAKLFVFVPC